jgi:hypothetical protein
MRNLAITSDTLVGGESAPVTQAVLWATAIVVALGAVAAIGSWMPVTLAVPGSAHELHGKIDEWALPHPGHGDEREVHIRSNAHGAGATAFYGELPPISVGRSNLG